MTAAARAERLLLPSTNIVHAVVRLPLRFERGRVLRARERGLPPVVETGLARLRTELTSRPYAAPAVDRLHDLWLDPKAVASAARVGRLLRLDPGVVLLHGADLDAVEVLRGLPQPFTTSEARTALQTSRRVALPLLEHLERRGLTRRTPDDRRTVI